MSKCLQIFNVISQNFKTSMLQPCDYPFSNYNPLKRYVFENQLSIEQEFLNTNVNRKKSLRTKIIFLNFSESNNFLEFECFNQLLSQVQMFVVYLQLLYSIKNFSSPIINQIRNKKNTRTQYTSTLSVHAGINNS